MSYAKDGYPTELANKVGHIKLIQDPMVQRLIESFEDHRPLPDAALPPISGNTDLKCDRTIAQVITVDGGHQTVPNIVRPERQVGFVQVALQMIKLETIEYLSTHPMADPRDVQKLIGNYTHHILAALPVVGMSLPGQTLKDSVREAVHRFIAHYGLYPALAYLVYRQWERQMTKQPSMQCHRCDEKIDLPRNQLDFKCAKCGESYKLSDYLGLSERDNDERSTEETVSNFRAALEVLAMFSLIVRFLEHEAIMRKTLFLLDGPLLLRAQLSRLVEPIRDLLEHQHRQERSAYIVGVEKNGEFRNFADSYATRLGSNGDYFIPTTKFLVESINGRIFDPATYRNRVNYGAKLVARVGSDHVFALNVPTGQFILEPQSSDLIGLEPILCCLSQLPSYAYDNALIPVVLANNASSISNQPSATLLAQFVDSLMKSG